MDKTPMTLTVTRAWLINRFRECMVAYHAAALRGDKAAAIMWQSEASRAQAALGHGTLPGPK